MSRGALCAALALGLVFASVGPRAAFAQDEERADLSDEAKREQRKAEAKKHFSVGAQLHEEGDYAGAAAAYEKSYQALPLPIMLFNIAQVLRLGGDTDGAIEHYERYLKLEPEGSGAADARAFLAELRRGREKKVEEGDEGEGSSEEVPPTTGDAGPEPQTAPPEGPPDPRRDQPIDISAGLDSGSGLKTAGMVTAAVGALALGTAGVLAWRAGVAESDLSNFEGEWGSSQADRYQSGRRMQRASLVLGGAGLAAVCVGAGLYLWGRPDGETRLNIGPTSGGAAAALSGRF